MQHSFGIILDLLLLACVQTVLTNHAHLRAWERRGVFAAQSCSRPIPNDPKGRTYNDKARKAFQDANTLVETVKNARKDFQNSTAFSHYFFNENIDHVLNVFTVIHERILRWGEPYLFTYACGDDMSSGCGGNGNFAQTNTRSGNAYMVFCDLWFKDWHPKMLQHSGYDLDSRKYSDQPGGWCREGQEYPFFVVAATTVIHEITHLNMVGSLAHLPPSGFIKKWGEPHYGTYDIYATGDPSDRAPFNNVDPWLSARRLRVFWERYRRGSSDYKPRLQTIQNAENYATAAMEYYVLRQCGWS